MSPINVVSSVPPEQNGINHEDRSWEEMNFDMSNRVCSKLQNSAVFEIYIKKIHTCIWIIIKRTN